MKTLKLTALAVAVMMTACEKTVYDEWSENSENTEYITEAGRLDLLPLRFGILLHTIFSY